MTITKVTVSEYECVLCGHKWINRVNGIDGPIPRKCAKCKRSHWDKGEETIMTPEEVGLRRRIKGLPALYYYTYRFYFKFGENPDPEMKDLWDVPLTAMFLTLDNPRPTIEELRRVLYPSGSKIGLDSQNRRRKRGWIPDPDKPGRMKYDPMIFTKVLDSDKQKILKTMEKIVIKQKGRGWREIAEKTSKEGVVSD